MRASRSLVPVAVVVLGSLLVFFAAMMLSTPRHTYAIRGRVEYDPATMRVIAVEGPLRINMMGRSVDVPAGQRFGMQNARLDLERGAIVPMEDSK